MRNNGAVAQMFPFFFFFIQAVHSKYETKPNFFYLFLNILKPDIKSDSI